MILSDVLSQGTKKLMDSNISDAALDAWYLFEHVFQMSKAQYFMNKNRQADERQNASYMKLIEERSEHIPLQHIIGRQEFMGFEFCVNEHVLIPRQDTECLVEEILPYANEKTVLDVCTGSGCIIISLSKLCNLKKADALDISTQALEVAMKNADRLNASVHFIESNLFSQISGKYDIIVSNPPYIPTTVIDGLMEEVKDHEPMLALDGKEDGLYFYRKIIKDAGKYLNPGGRIFFEIGCEQAQAVSELLRNHRFTDIAVKKDLAGLDRIVMGRML